MALLLLFFAVLSELLLLAAELEATAPAVEGADVAPMGSFLLAKGAAGWIG